MLHEQISGYLDIKEKLIVWPETFLLLSSTCQREGTVREEIALQVGETHSLVLGSQQVTCQ